MVRKHWGRIDRANHFLKLGGFVGGVTDPDAMSPLQPFSVFERNRRRRRLPHLLLHIEKVISPGGIDQRFASVPARPQPPVVGRVASVRNAAQPRWLDYVGGRDWCVRLKPDLLEDEEAVLIGGVG